MPTLNSSTTVTTDDLITQIPLHDLHESPFNPRRTFTGIEELAASIQAEGRVHQPLLVRPRITNTLRPDESEGFEVIFGHRRLRAAEQAGLASVPCMVRAMTDAEARSAQIAENLQRADVHPIEEAEGMQAMMADGLSADELAATVGKSRSYVYSRLKLLQACPPVRMACLQGEIGSEVALLVARVGHDKLQGKALAAIRAQNLDMKDGGATSYRRIKELLKDKFTLHVGRTFFDPQDATLVPAAGTCSACPKLSGNAPEFADLCVDTPGPWHGYTHKGDPELCTDPECFEGKKTAQLARQASALQAQGKTVITGNKARQAVSAHGEVKGAYVALKDVKAELKKVAAGKAKPATVVIQDPRTGKTFEAVATADLQAAGLAQAEPKKASSRGGHDEAAARREREEREQQAQADTAANRRLLATVRSAAAQRPRTAEELRLVLEHLLEDASDTDDTPALCHAHGLETGYQLAHQLPTMTPDQMGLLLLDLVLVRGVECTYWRRGIPDGLASMAALYGIDVDQARAEPEVQTPVVAQDLAPAEAAPTPGTAARAAKKGAGGKPAAKKAGKGPAIKYRCARTGSTWSGRGLQPAWVKAHLAAGGTLAELETARAAPAAQKVKDDAGSAGEAERDPNTADMFEQAGV
jgi:ParB/RepB/Spo0J family partition protein